MIKTITYSPGAYLILYAGDGGGARRDRARRIGGSDRSDRSSRSEAEIETQTQTDRP